MQYLSYISGAGDKLAKDSANDYDQKITVKTKAGSYWSVSSDSKVFPWNITYKLGEEFEWDMSGVPGMPEGMDLKGPYLCDVRSVWGKGGNQKANGVREVASIL